jgi:hypothetical protein
MTGYEEAEKLLQQNLGLLQAQGSDKSLIPVNIALYLLSKATLRLAQSFQDQSLISPSKLRTHI